METKWYTSNDMESVIACLQAGEVIAFPTDTVYGLGVVYDDEQALTCLKQAKIRPDEKPIPMMISSLSQIEEVAYVDATAKMLIENFMPGGFTLVLKKKESVPSFVSNGLDTIALRMPDDAFVLGLMNGLQKPMLVSSANISAQHSCQTDKEVFSQLGGRIHGIVEGKSKSDIASTIVSVMDGKAKLLRLGSVSKEAIENVLKGELL